MNSCLPIANPRVKLVNPENIMEIPIADENCSGSTASAITTGSNIAIEHRAIPAKVMNIIFAMNFLVQSCPEKQRKNLLKLEFVENA